MDLGIKDLAAQAQQSSEPLASILGAIQAAVDGETSNEEAAWIARIEGLREQLLTSKEEISVSLPYPTAKEKFGVVGEIAKARSVRPIWGMLMFKLIRALKPATALELGTAVGLSAAFEAAALEINGSGKLLTLEGSAGVSALAARNFDKLRLARVQARTGLFKDTLDGALRDLGEVDFAFIDGHHDEHATVEYFEKILPFTPAGKVIVFDDINWSDGMKNAWRLLLQHPKINTSVDVRKLGICVIGESGKQGQHIKLPHLEKIAAPA
jgi:predicted O-methyltransferase YrrM